MNHSNQLSPINFKREVNMSMSSAIEKVTEALKNEGFGILTRIDFDQKIKEKLNKDLRPTVILGACNPQMAYEAFMSNPDVSSLLPCNVVVRELSEGKVSIEVVKPSALMSSLGDQKLVELAKDADSRLSRALGKI